MGVIHTGINCWEPGAIGYSLGLLPHPHPSGRGTVKQEHFAWSLRVGQPHSEREWTVTQGMGLALGSEGHTAHCGSEPQEASGQPREGTAAQQLMFPGDPAAVPGVSPPSLTPRLIVWLGWSLLTPAIGMGHVAPEAICSVPWGLA